LTAWRAPLSRPTVDIDLMGRTSNELDYIRVIIDQLCNMETAADGVQFDPSSISAQDENRSNKGRTPDGLQWAVFDVKKEFWFKEPRMRAKVFGGIAISGIPESTKESYRGIFGRRSRLS
jgi:hypothetical protein